MLSSIEIKTNGKHIEIDKIQYDTFCNIRYGGKNGKFNAESRKKMSDAKKGTMSPNKGRSYGEIYGIEKARDIRDKISNAGTGRIAWNRGESTGIQSKEIVEKRIKAIALTKEKQFESDYNNILHYINEKGSIKCVQHSEVDINTRKKMITRINRLVADSKIKQFWFGANDVRYTLPDFSLKHLITDYISSNVDVNRKDITQYLHQAVGITKRKVSTTITELIKEEYIIQYRGYRTNHYKVADNKKIKTK